MPKADYQRPESVQALVVRLIELGYFPVPIPKGCKGPTVPGWQNLALSAEDVPRYFSEPGMLVGILHKNTAALDIDVYDPELSRQIVEEALRRFPGALERVGQEPKSALFLRMEGAGFKVQNTEKHEKVTEDGEIFSAQVEIRTVTRQVVVYGQHPDTGKLYRWTRGELWATPWADLPVISEAEARSFRDWANDKILKWAGKADPKIIDIGLYPRSIDERPSERSFLAALKHVPPSLGHEAGWCAALMAIHDFYAGSVSGLEVAKEWSSGDARYNPREVEVKWKSFETGKGVSYKTIFALAKQNGADLSAIARIDRPAREMSAMASFDHGPSQAVQSFDAPPSATWVVQRADAFTADFVAPEYLIDGIVQRGRLYTLTAPTGSGKTAVMLYAATAISTGNQFCGCDVEAGDVLFMAGENPDDVRARVIATLEFYKLDARDCRLHFIAGTFSIRADLERLREEAAKLPNLTMVIIDTFAAYFDGDDENSNAQALDFARLVRKITAFPSKPAVIMPAHPVKNATRGNLSPKGGSSLLNEVDGNLTLWNDSGVITMHWQGKFRGAEFDALTMELQRYETASICDSNGQLIPTILAKPMLTMRAQQVAKENLKIEDRLLMNVADAPALSLAERGAVLGLSHKMKVVRLLEKLESQKLIRRFRTNWELTKDGERAIEIITSGGGFAAEI